MMKRKKNCETDTRPVENAVYRSDAPASDPKHDRFGRFPFAQRVAQTLARQEDPSSIVIAIHGAWGEGKTTVLDYIDSELRGHHADVICVRFNPWRFTDEGTLLRSFFDTVADGFKRSLTTRKERIGKLMQEYGRLATITVEYQSAKVSVGEGIEELGAFWSTTSLDEKKLKVEELLKKEGRRIVVLIDDIDRLERSEVRQLFKLVKLTGDFEYMSYVLAFDPDMVARALGETFGSGTTMDGANFLDKIVQVPLTLPKADPGELQEYCFDLVNEALRVANVQLPAESQQKFEIEFDLYFAPVLDTPRVAKRYANALAFIMPLLAGEVNSFDVMLLEAIKIFYPALHTAIRESPESFTGGPHVRDENERLKAKQWMKERLSGNSVTERLVKRLFPLVRGVLRDGKFDSGDEVEWSQQQRVASREYLRRYLACAVPRGDISDRRIDELMAQLEGLTQENGSNPFLAFIAVVHPIRFLWKIRLRATQMDERFARKLALIIARNGDGLPEPADKNALGSPRSSAAFLIRMLLARIQDPNARLEAAEDVLATAEPLTFAHQCFQSMRPQADGTDVLLHDVTKLENLLASRIVKIAQNTSLWKAFPVGIYWMILLFHWQKNRGSQELHAYYRRALAADSLEGVALVRFQLGLAIPGPMTDDFQLDHYKSIALLADPEDVYQSLKTVDRSQITSVDAKLLKQFDALHEQGKKTPITADSGQE